MTTYRLPEALGGREAELVQWSCDGYPSFASLQVDDVVVIVPQECVTVVVPPEPPVGTCVLVDYTAGSPNGVVFRRYALGWTEPGRDADAPGFKYLDWAKVCSYGTPAALAVDPFAEPVDLPWTHTDPEGYLIGIYGSQRIWAAARVGRGDHCVDLTAKACRDMARALWAVADHDEVSS